MASISGTVWAIDIGNSSLKALRLRDLGDGSVEVIGFDNIPHGKILSGAGMEPAERDELIAISLRTFVRQNDIGKDEIIISVPSQNSFARFVNLPPVEQKRIPEIVRFEAAQQIPFNINEVQWDWQLMESQGPTTRVGIFAIKNDVVNSALDHFSRENLQVTYVQMAPMALYNYILHDRKDLFKSEDAATVVLNIGAENTDLVICTKSTVWQRCIPMGGDSFTRAIADAFKLTFQKAEKLKRTAPMSKYARQVLQAMKPVFSDLASEIQRSLGFYSSSNPNTKLTRIITLGGGTKLSGLIKYLQQTLQIPIERPDSFSSLALNESVSTAKFHENISEFGIVYGLAIQGLGLGKIENNLLPGSVARTMLWASKAKYFYAAACLLLLVSVLAFARTFFDKMNYSDESSTRDKTKRIIETANEATRKLDAEKGKSSMFKTQIEQALAPLNNRDMITLLNQTILSVLPNEKNNPGQKSLYQAFASGDTVKVMSIPRKDRKQLFVTGMSVYYSDDVANAQFGDEGFMVGGQKGTRPGIRGGGKPGLLMPSMDPFSPFGLGGKKSSGPRTGGAMRGRKDAAEGGAPAKPGYIVTIAGYSPYKEIKELLDPIGSENDPNKWGFVTRLMHLDDPNVIGNSNKFELFNKTKLEHFKIENGEVALENDMPVGIGVEEVRTIKNADKQDVPETVLIDPMTKEVISRITEVDAAGKPKLDRSSGKPVYTINDRWFLIQAKFVLKGEKPAENAAANVQSQETQTKPVKSPQKSEPGSSPVKRSGRRGDSKF